jgi:uncharacterized membrane protein HdeD (DUF308 family)
VDIRHGQNSNLLEKHMTNTQVQSGLGPSLAGSALLSALAQNWWLLLLRGIAAIAFGVLAFFWPGITLLTLTLLWGAYALSDGILALWAAISGRGFNSGSRWWLAFAGIAGILSGVIAFFLPGMTALVLLLFIASWAIVIGVLQIWGAIQLRKEMEGEWLLALNGLLSVAFGVLVMAQPGAGALAVVWTIGWYAILAGCIYIGLAFRLKNARA